MNIFGPKFSQRDESLLQEVGWGDANAVLSVKELVMACYRRRRSVTIAVAAMYVALAIAFTQFSAALFLLCASIFFIAMLLVTRTYGKDVALVGCLIDVMRLSDVSSHPSPKERRVLSRDITAAALNFRRAFSLPYWWRLAKAQRKIFDSMSEDGYEALVSFNASAVRGGPQDLRYLRDSFARALLRLGAARPDEVCLLNDPLAGQYGNTVTAHSRADWLRHPVIPSGLALLAAVVAGAVKIVAG